MSGAAVAALGRLAQQSGSEKLSPSSPLERLQAAGWGLRCASSSASADLRPANTQAVANLVAMPTWHPHSRSCSNTKTELKAPAPVRSHALLPCTPIILLAVLLCCLLCRFRLHAIAACLPWLLTRSTDVMLPVFLSYNYMAAAAVQNSQTTAT